VTDMMGNLLNVTVHTANIHDTKAGGKILKSALKKHPTIKGVCADAGYRKTFESVAAELSCKADISERIKREWEVLPKRWRVERTFAWMNHSRRLSKDYEVTTISVENMVVISYLHSLLKRY